MTAVRIKTHGSVLCGLQTRVHFTGVKKMPFSRMCNSALPEQKHTKFLYEFPRGGAPSVPNLS